MKANAFIIDAMQDHIDRYEVCSPGEFRICERAGIPMEKIVMSGVYKAEEDIHRVIQNVWDRNRLYGGIAAPVRTDQCGGAGSRDRGARAAACDQRQSVRHR